jgi:branched-chain amino acid transport system ATP-binding protein
VTAAATPATTAVDPIFEVEHVTLRFGGVTSLADVSLHQERGEILSVIGPNGAGKTSLFNCLSGVYLPQEGSIHFRRRDGRAVSIVGKKPHAVNRAGVARTFQTTLLFNALSTIENVKIGVEAGSTTGPIGAMLHLPHVTRQDKETDREASRLLEFVGLTSHADDLASSLSYGDRRRLEIARALGTKPEVLLLDEPAAGTNPTEKVELSKLITEVNTAFQVSVLLIEHDMRLVMSIAQRIYVLNFGRLIAEGTPAEIQRNPAVLEAYLGTSEDTEATAGSTPSIEDAGATGDTPPPGTPPGTETESQT